MSKTAGVAEILAAIRALDRPSLIGIDGLPCAGKSTLSDRLAGEVAASQVWLDDFVRPEADWAGVAPAFPFPHIRYDAFMGTVRALAETGEARFLPFDWCTYSTSAEIRTVTLQQHVVVEGVSTLNSQLCPLYALRIFVDSDPSSMMAAAEARGLGPWAKPWRDLFMPSVAIYMQTRPEMRADFIVAGRYPDGSKPA